MALVCIRDRAVATIGAGLSSVAWFLASKYWDRPAIQVELDSLSEARRQVIQNGLDDYETLLVVLAKHFQGTHEQTSAEFRELVADVPLANSFEQLALVSRVQGDQRVEHEQAMTRQGFPGYRITALDPDGKASIASEQGEYFAVVSLAGLDAPLSMGLDIKTVPALEGLLQAGRGAVGS